MVYNNVCHENDTEGILCENTTACNIRVEFNRITDNDTDGLKMDGPGGLVIRNTCAGNVNNYLLHANTNYGPIINVVSVGDISGTTNADHPYANFEY